MTIAKHKTVADFITSLTPEKAQQVNVLRESILSSRPDLKEHIKWNAPSYALDGEERITFNVKNKADQVSLIMHMGATRKEDTDARPVLETDEGLVRWNSNIRGVIAFKNLEDVRAKLAVVLRVLDAWLAIPATPEKEIIDDNARKFIIQPLGEEFLENCAAKTYTLTVDWLVTDENNETKLAYKVFEDGSVQILNITKSTKNSKRATQKEAISKVDYERKLASTILHLKKERSEFIYVQNGTSFAMNYDIFEDGALYMLEVDADTDEQRIAFDPNAFSEVVSEVTGDLRYYGYRVTSVLSGSSS